MEKKETISERLARINTEYHGGPVKHGERMDGGGAVARPSRKDRFASEKEMGDEVVREFSDLYDTSGADMVEIARKAGDIGNAMGFSAIDLTNPENRDVWYGAVARTAGLKRKAQQAAVVEEPPAQVFGGTPGRQSEKDASEVMPDDAEKNAQWAREFQEFQEKNNMSSGRRSWSAA